MPREKKNSNKIKSPSNTNGGQPKAKKRRANGNSLQNNQNMQQIQNNYGNPLIAANPFDDYPNNQNSNQLMHPMQQQINGPRPPIPPQQQRMNIQQPNQMQHPIHNHNYQMQNDSMMNFGQQQMNGPPMQLNGPPHRINVPPNSMNGQMNGIPQQMNGIPQQINGPPVHSNGQPSNQMMMQQNSMNMININGTNNIPNYNQNMMNNNLPNQMNMQQNMNMNMNMNMRGSQPPPNNQQMKMMPVSSGKTYPSNQFLISNPNAQPIFVCGACQKEVHDNEQGINCESGCNFWYHRTCTGLTENAFILLKQEEYAEWACDNCCASKVIPLVKYKA